MSAEAQSDLAEVASRVVAWHNRHPLARRISRKDVQGIGVVVLPFARDGQPAWDAPQPKRSLLALMFAPRRKRRLWPVFSEDLVPEIGAKALARFATHHALDKRPGPADLPERVALFDRALLDGPGGKPAELPPERLQRYLLSAAIDIGARPSRVMLGAGRRPAVLGQRLWSLPRLAGLGAAALVLMVGAVAALWLKAMAPKPAAVAAPPQPAAVASAAAASTPAASRGAAASAPAAPLSAGVASAAPSVPGAATAAAAPAAASAAAPAPAPAPPAAAPSASAAAPPAVAVASAPLAAAAPASAPPPAAAPQRASAPLVPRLKPDLAAQAQADAAGRVLRAPAASAPAGLASGAALPGPAAAPVWRPPSAATAASAARFYALVSKPMRSKAEAEALLRRVRAESERINHPTATQTSLLDTGEGWRVSWWPFTHQRQADNARAALARRFELEVVEF